MAQINQDLCVQCETCIPYCTVGAIHARNGTVEIDPTECTECYVCIRNHVCPVDAIEHTPLDTPMKQFQHVISDPTETHGSTGVPGRGTEEAKTNDVTGRYKRGEVGIGIDMGRPGLGCYLRDVQTVAMAVTQAGVKLEGADTTPLASLMTDLNTGKIKDEYLNTRVLSVIIEGKCPMENLPNVLRALREVEGKIDTVFSLGLVSRVDADGKSPVPDILEKAGLPRPIRGKVNVGLGRPLVD